MSRAGAGSTTAKGRSGGGGGGGRAGGKGGGGGGGGGSAYRYKYLAEEVREAYLSDKETGVVSAMQGWGGVGWGCNYQPELNRTQYKGARSRWGAVVRS